MKWLSLFFLVALVSCQFPAPLIGSWSISDPDMKLYYFGTDGRVSLLVTAAAPPNLSSTRDGNYEANGDLLSINWDDDPIHWDARRFLIDGDIMAWIPMTGGPATYLHRTD